MSISIEEVKAIDLKVRQTLADMMMPYAQNGDFVRMKLVAAAAIATGADTFKIMHGTGFAAQTLYSAADTLAGSMVPETAKKSGG